jgi:hypothetical protein
MMVLPLKVVRLVNVVHVALVLASIPLIRSAPSIRTNLVEKVAIPRVLEKVAVISRQN